MTWRLNKLEIHEFPASHFTSQDANSILSPSTIEVLIEVLTCSVSMPFEPNIFIENIFQNDYPTPSKLPGFKVKVPGFADRAKVQRVPAFGNIFPPGFRKRSRAQR